MSLTRETDPFLLHQYSEQALQAAARGNVAELLEAIADGADLNFVRVHMTPLQVVLNDSNPNWEIVDVLVKNGSNVNVKNKSGWSLLHQACSNNWGDFAQLLLDNAAIPFVTDLRGITPLHVVADKGYVDLTQKLLATGVVEVDAIDFEGETALMKAARGNHLAIVKQLCEAGADLSLVNEQGLGILDIADRDYDIQDYLRQQLQSQPTTTSVSQPEVVPSASTSSVEAHTVDASVSPEPAPAPSGLSSIKKRKLG